MPAGSRQAHTIPAAASLGRLRSACPAFVRVAIAGLMVCLTGPLFAETIILDNTGTATPLTPGTSVTVTNGQYQGIVFTSLANETLTNLTIVPLWASGSATLSYTISLYGVDGSNRPTGTALATSSITGVFVDQSSNTATKADAVDMDLTTSFTGSWLVASGSTYAVTLSSDTSNTNSGFAAIADSPTTANGTYIGRVYSASAGADWLGPFGTSTPYMKLSAVPEPSAIGLALAGLAGGLGYTSLRRRRRKAELAGEQLAA